MIDKKIKSGTTPRYCPKQVGLENHPDCDAALDCFILELGDDFCAYDCWPRAVERVNNFTHTTESACIKCKQK